MNNLKSIPILLVEDDEADILILKRALKKCEITNPLYVTNNGEEALEFLTHKNKYSDTKSAPRPGLILLDINMPRMDGRELLEKIKNNLSLRSIPTIILTTSKSENDIENMYKLGANSYIPKPINFKDFIIIIDIIFKYWLFVAKIPLNHIN